MPIISVQCFPRIAIENFVKTLDGDEPIITDYAIISIIDTDARPVITEPIQRLLTTKRCFGTLTLQFDDLTKTEYEKHFDEYEYRGMKLFNSTHAKQIIRFVDDVNKLENNIRLWVHCTMGISRSGAVGTFVTDYFRLDYNKFKGNSPAILPNIFVLSELRKHSGTSY